MSEETRIRFTWLWETESTNGTGDRPERPGHGPEITETDVSPHGTGTGTGTGTGIGKGTGKNTAHAIHPSRPPIPLSGVSLCFIPDQALNIFRRGAPLAHIPLSVGSPTLVCVKLRSCGFGGFCLFFYSFFFAFKGLHCQCSAMDPHVLLMSHIVLMCG